MFTLITVFVGAKKIDLILEGLDEKKAALIMTTSPDKILEEITSQMARGVTVLEERAGFTGDRKEILYIVINQQEMVQLRQVINKIDDEAYVTVNNVHEILGKG